MSGTQTSFLDNLKAAVRENPLAAALIGGGAVWLLMGSEKLKSAASSASAAAAPLADIGARNLRSAAPRFEKSPPTAPEMDNGLSLHVNEAMHGATSAASDAVSGAADAMRDRFDEGVSYARENFSKLGEALPRRATLAQAQASFSHLLERQPLMLGAIGLAVVLPLPAPSVRPISRTNGSASLATALRRT